MRNFTALILYFFICGSAISFAQDTKTVAEQLGYDKNTKLLIIHADDIGVSHSVNKASFQAFQSGAISSGSIMVPCPWLLEVAAFAKANPQFDLGLHLTLTAEWEQYKWDGVASSNTIPSLLNDQQHFYDNTAAVRAHAKAEEVRIEIQAQIDYAKQLGIQPTHLDSHMGALSVRPDIAQVYLEVGAKNKIPVFLPKRLQPLVDSMDFDQKNLTWVDRYYMLDGTTLEPSNWPDFYLDVVNNLEVGLNVLLVHLGEDNEELQAVTINHPAFGATWRALDLEVLESDAFKTLLKKNNIKVIQWRDIKNIMYPTPI